MSMHDLTSLTDFSTNSQTKFSVNGTDEIGTRTHFIRAWTAYLHSPSTDKMGTGAKFIRARAAN